MTSKHFIATILGLAMTVTGFAAAPARAMSEEDIAKLLFGITTLAIIGAAVSDNDHDRVAPAPVRPRPKPSPIARPSKPYQYNLPHRCARNYRTGNGRIVQDYGLTCLKRAQVKTKHLPQACFQQTRTEQGRTRRGFRTHCLSRNGYRVSWQ